MGTTIMAASSATQGHSYRKVGTGHDLCAVSSVCVFGGCKKTKSCLDMETELPSTLVGDKEAASAATPHS